MKDLIPGMQSLSQFQNEQLRTRCNEVSAPFGLVLSDAAMKGLQQHRNDTLKSTGRIEFGGGILEKLVMAFCDSPYLSQSNYEETLTELQELFYSFKNECRDLVSDDELIEGMLLIYEEVAGGSTEYLSGIEWETMYRIARTGSIEGTELERPPLTEDFDDDFE